MGKLGIKIISLLNIDFWDMTLCGLVDVYDISEKNAAYIFR
jgi:hypothetical protein